MLASSLASSAAALLPPPWTPRAVRGRRAAAVAALGSACLALAAARCSMGSSLRAAAAEARVLAGAAALLGALAALEGWVRGPAVFFVAAVPPATSLSCGLLPFGELDWTLVAFGALAAVASAALVRRRAHALDAAHIQRQRHTEAKQQSVEVLRLMVPEQVIAQLQQGNHQYAERFPSASVFFVEVCGLDEDCGLGPAERLQALNTVFSHFDGVASMDDGRMHVFVDGEQAVLLQSGAEGLRDTLVGAKEDVEQADAHFDLIARAAKMGCV